jgi:5-(carboxyamino)imidazole ribonucleotide mutase
MSEQPTSTAKKQNESNPLVGIIMGSESDLEIMKGAAEMLRQFEVEPELTIVSAHRTPERLRDYAIKAKARGIKVIIAGAGGAAHLPGMVAANTILPVIGVPVSLKNLDGMDSLLSIVQMPGGIPVATVGINSAKNAGLLAVAMLAIVDKNLEKITQLKKEFLDFANNIWLKKELFVVMSESLITPYLIFCSSGFKSWILNIFLKLKNLIFPILRVILPNFLIRARFVVYIRKSITKQAIMWLI